MFHVPSILNSDALYDKYAEKKLTLYFDILVKLLRILVSPYFQLHKVLCLSFTRPSYKPDPHVAFCVKTTYLACLMSYF